MPASPSSRIRQTVLPFLPRLRGSRCSDERGLAPAEELGFGIISRFCPIELVERVIAESGRTQRRVRLLPAYLVVYCLLLLCLYSDAGQQEVLRRMALGAPRPGRWRVPTNSALIQAKGRLGWEVMERLFRASAGPLATTNTGGAFWRGWRLMAVDGSTLEVANTTVNECAFGGATTTDKVRTGNPQIRCAALVECATHVVVDAAMGGYLESELALVAPFVRSLDAQMLVLGDRNMVSAELWAKYTATGAQLLWRANQMVASKVEKHLPDGSYLAVISSSANKRLKVRVRVIEYVIVGAQEVYRLLTSLLDPAHAPADELAGLYHERWEIEGTYDEVKTHQRGPRAVLRSKSPDGVRQEFWAHLVLHGIVRKLAFKASQTLPERDPDHISFVASLQVIRRSATSGTGRGAGPLHYALQLALRELVEPRARVVRRPRSYPRVVGHQQPRYPSRRARPASSRGRALPTTIVMCGA